MHLKELSQSIKTFFAWRKAETKVVHKEEALRSALFNAEQMESYGEELARSHSLRKKPGTDKLLPRLDDNERLIVECCKMFSAVTALSKVDRRISPAGEWLLDNYWMVEEQINTTRKHLPKSYSLELPQLTEGESAGFPRVYDIALKNVSHGDGRLDVQTLARFLASYQTVSHLSLGELWAIPIMLRLALIENLRRVATRVMAAWQDQTLAVQWANRLIESLTGGRKGMAMVIAEMASSNPPMSSAFVAELARRLQGQGPALTLPLTWISELLSEVGYNIDQMIQLDTQQQAADQVSISNSMTSLRQLAAMDWRDFVEELSTVEQTLRKDPAGVYPRMDFASRDHYRHQIEGLAKKYQLPEERVARLLLEVTEDERDYVAASPERAMPGRASLQPEAVGHVGYFLIGEGQTFFKHVLARGGKAPKGKKRHVLRSRGRATFYTYLSMALLLGALAAFPFLLVLQRNGIGPLGLVLAAIPAFIVGTELSGKLVNWLATLLVPPYIMPKMDYMEGIPPEARTLVAVPTMLGGLDDVEELLNRLEVHFLSNRDPNVQFGLLTDFKDSDTETEVEDEAILQAISSGLDELNQKYPGRGVEPFFICHRPRRWNATQGIWMGYERKRGKLCEFNELLAGKGRERFQLIRGNAVDFPPPAGIAPVRYVITLDTDTQLPRDSARKLVGAMDHIMNRPVYDPQKRQVVGGHAIMQPRVGTTLVSASRSLYAELTGADAGIDPYTRSVSDVYQDIFRQGSYIGKGIYDAQIFEKVLGGRFPDDSILSHDLIEGCYTRSGLISDVVFYEDNPSNYNADVSRRYRWIRGDWQLLPWLFPTVRTRDGSREKNPLSVLSCWKLVDNLRRSLFPASLVIMFLIGWFLSGSPLGWTLGLVGMGFVLAVICMLWGLHSRGKGISLRRHIINSISGCAGQCLFTLFSLTTLAHEAQYSTDAALRTVWRVFVSKKNLLQWSTSSDAEKSSVRTLHGLYRVMIFSPLLAVLVFLALVYLAPRALPAALPLLLLWLVAPAVAWAISRPRRRAQFKPNQEQLRFLRMLTRRTWAFFETYVNQDNNWLPPDNVQETPELMVAQRTSPTNMGLSLLSHLAAHDFGYISTGYLLDRLEKSFNSMDELERYRGHFYNWYDISNLRPLQPQYVSTVDSGNLAGHLMTLRQGLLEIREASIFDRRVFDGLVDTADILSGLQMDKNEPEWRKFLSRLSNMRIDTFGSLEEAAKAMRELLAQANKLAASFTPEKGSEQDFWLDRLLEQCRELSAELDAFALPDGLFPEGNRPYQVTLERLIKLDPDTLPPETRGAVLNAQARAASHISRTEALALRAGRMALMDFSFLFDRQRDLLSIGYNVNEHRLDPSYYDLLASEARLTYYTAIAQGQLPQESWYALGRLLTTVSGSPVLLAWSGSMFEYLMPPLVMPSYTGSLLDETCIGAVKGQIAYGKELGLPWGISESGYSTQDGSYAYQYRAFGVPGLGLERGLGEDIVLAPYATAMALMVIPDAACKNLQRLTSAGLAGRYGMYEAVDYTSIRLPRGKNFSIVYSFMSHHQGMSLLALTSTLLGKPMQRRFLADPEFQAARLLLEERVPRSTPDYTNTCGDLSVSAAHTAARLQDNQLRIIKDPDIQEPAVQLLSNGSYHVMLSSAGSGYSRFHDLALTRWEGDTTRDACGTYCYLRDLDSGMFWSAAHQPVRAAVDSYEAIFCDARAEFRTRAHDFDTHTEIVVSPEDNVELRRITITNRGKERRGVELTSYTEAVLARPDEDAAHPAFSKLFVQTELLPELQAVLASRRPRSAEEKRRYMFHLLAAHNVDIHEISYETSRNTFIGRGRSLQEPAAMYEDKLSGEQGSVLDPILSIRARISLEAGESATFDLVLGTAESRNDCISLMEKFRDHHLADRVFDLAWTHSQVLLHQFNATLFDSHLYQRMASPILYPTVIARSEAEILRSNLRGQNGLWGQSISGDNPVVLVKISDSSKMDMVSQMVKAHSYWRMKGLIVDMVIWHEDHYSYRQNLQDLILSVIPSGAGGSLLDRPGGIFVRSAQQMAREDRILIQAVARLVISDTGGSLSDQVYKRRATSWMPAACEFRSIKATNAGSYLSNYQSRSGSTGLSLTNAYGGFSADGKEYVITLKPGQNTPAPWCNVLAGELLGTVISESGGSYTWRENAYGYRLTPWRNDPVTDLSGEALYIRDEETGEYWSPTPLPRRGDGVYTTRHGFGYSVFEHSQNRLESQLTVFVAKEAPVKFQLLRLKNLSGKSRRVSVTGYAEWVLGDRRSKTAMHVVTESNSGAGTIFARNSYTMDFPGRVAFYDCSAQKRTFTCDRTEFIGRNGSLYEPAAMDRVCLSGRSGPGFDPCAAIQTGFEIGPYESVDVVFTLGAGGNADEAAWLSQRFSSLSAAAQELDGVKRHWEHLLGAVQVETPNQAFNVMTNGWLMYQNIASRYLARSGYYQSSGAFGFRDQLQDSMAMLYSWPEQARLHLLRSAAHQFPEGDVLHWWHPPTDRGVRTRFSDDYLWLPVAVERYVRVTGDASVLDEEIGYLDMRRLSPDEESFYDQPGQSSIRESLYRHCVRSIKYGLKFGEHGLPLMGGGDWNDGMDRVGIHGKGESVWLGFFLYDVLQKFSRLAELKGDQEFAALCRAEADKLRTNLDLHGWDGEWYRRAYFDDGTPLGSAQNDECRIDSISQSWAVLSGAAPEARYRQGMKELDEQLVRRDLGLLKLLTPPFDKSALEPGYIKGYVPGVRENGGQYTHAAVWASMAFAEMGDLEKAWETAMMINPVSHGTPELVELYKVEPYVVAADVYMLAGHEGRGGWSWYTGAAGWLYRLFVESLLGLSVEADQLRLNPLLPPDWNEAALTYRYHGSSYRITIHRAADPAQAGVHLDGKWLDDGAITMQDDGKEHQVEILLK